MTAPLRRYVFAAIIVAVIGIAVSFLTWIRTLEERRIELAKLLGSLADETAGAVEWQLEREMKGLRGLASFWQLHGLLEPQAWRTDSRLLLDHFTGIQWIAWVPTDTSAIRFVGRDSTVRLDPEALAESRVLLRAPVPKVTDRWDDAYRMRVFLPVRQHGSKR
jgi:sensor domain CHASE-containing protein